MEAPDPVLLKYGNTNTFLVPGKKGNLLVDTDYSGLMPRFFKSIRDAGVQVKDITWMMATHYHPDHMGLLGELQEMGVQLLIPDVQVLTASMAEDLYYPNNSQYVRMNLKQAKKISCRESRKFLKTLGIEGEIVPLQSHSRDSVALMLDSGGCIVGDLEPREFLAGYAGNPGLAEDWRMLMEHRPKIVYFGHANSKRL